MLRIAALVLALAVCVALSGCGSSSPASAPLSSEGVLASVVAAARAQTSVHWTSTNYGEFAGIWTETADVGKNSGSEREVSSVFGTVRIRFAQGTVYVRGSVRQLREMAGLSRAEARRYAGRWISIPRGDHWYGAIADGLTLASIIHDVTTCDLGEGTRLTIVRKKPQGQRLVGLRWANPKGPGQECRLSASGSRRPLPVSSRFFGPGRGSSLHLSKWNEPVHVEAPTSSTPIATVRRN